MTYAYRFAKAYQEQLLESSGYAPAEYSTGHQQNKLAVRTGMGTIAKIWRQLTSSSDLNGTQAPLESTARLSQRTP